MINNIIYNLLSSLNPLLNGNYIAGSFIKSVESIILSYSLSKNINFGKYEILAGILGCIQLLLLGTTKDKGIGIGIGIGIGTKNIWLLYPIFFYLLNEHHYIKLLILLISCTYTLDIRYLIVVVIESIIIYIHKNYTDKEQIHNTIFIYNVLLIFPILYLMFTSMTSTTTSKFLQSNKISYLLMLIFGNVFVGFIKDYFKLESLYGSSTELFTIMSYLSPLLTKLYNL